jgi:hypothetical protein
LIYPVGHDLDGLSARLDAEYFLAERPRYFPSANWTNRTTRIAVIPAQRRVLMSDPRFR